MDVINHTSVQGGFERVLTLKKFIFPTCSGSIFAGPVLSLLAENEEEHVWVLAVKKESTFKNEASRHIDDKLRKLNADYNTFRSQQRIAAPEALVEDEDLICQWSQKVRGKLGGQSKIPHIDPTSDGSLIISLKDFIGSRGAGP